VVFLHRLLDQNEAGRKSPRESLSGRISRVQGSGKGACAIRVLSSPGHKIRGQVEFADNLLKPW
jgi:hypothetical protein